jgi:hypothetical protein
MAVHDAYPSWLCESTLECKNYGTGVSMDVLRELVGLAIDLEHLKWPLTKRGSLVSAHSVTANARALAKGYNVSVLANASPGQPDDWVASVADELE